MKTILILEDDVIFSRSIGNWLKKKGMATEHATTLSAARKALSAREFDLVLADLRLPDGNSTSLLEWMNERFYATPFLIMTNYGQVENAVEAMQLGAANYLCKPVQPDKLLEAIGKIFSRSRNDGSEFYRGESAKAREMYRLVGLVARSDISVLIRGASGTGKEHIARELHEQSHRRNKPFVPVDCGTITGDLAKSEFFGHRKGTFTGAYGDRCGLFQTADRGTLFLDEIGNLSPETQMLLLRALQERRYKPVRSTREYAFDVRLVAATNENLERAISEGRFREDLFHRLNEFFSVDDVYVKVMRALREISVEHVDEVVHSLRLVFAEGGRRNREGVRDTVSAIFVRNFGDRIERCQRAARVTVVHRVCAGCERLARFSSVGGRTRFFAVNHV